MFYALSFFGAEVTEGLPEILKEESRKDIWYPGTKTFEMLLEMGTPNLKILVIGKYSSEQFFLVVKNSITEAQSDILHRTVVLQPQQQLHWALDIQRGIYNLDFIKRTWDSTIGWYTALCEKNK